MDTTYVEDGFCLCLGPSVEFLQAFHLTTAVSSSLAVLALGAVATLLSSCFMLSSCCLRSLYRALMSHALAALPWCIGLFFVESSSEKSESSEFSSSLSLRESFCSIPFLAFFFFLGFFLFSALLAPSLLSLWFSSRNLQNSFL